MNFDQQIKQSPGYSGASNKIFIYESVAKKKKDSALMFVCFVRLQANIQMTWQMSYKPLTARAEQQFYLCKYRKDAIKV